MNKNKSFVKNYIKRPGQEANIFFLQKSLQMAAKTKRINQIDCKT